MEPHGERYRHLLDGREVNIHTHGFTVQSSAHRQTDRQDKHTVKKKIKTLKKRNEIINRLILPNRDNERNIQYLGLRHLTMATFVICLLLNFLKITLQKCIFHIQKQKPKFLYNLYLQNCTYSFQSLVIFYTSNDITFCL